MTLPLARPRRRAAAVVCAAALAVGLAGCTSDPEPAGPVTIAGPTATEAPTEVPTGDAAQDAMLATYGLDGMDGPAIIEHLETLGGSDRPEALMASVRPTELLLSDASGETSLPLPDDKFYLSFAPYYSQTHDCFHHSLTTCQGEFVQEPVQVKIVDEASGEVLLDEIRTTEENGFIGVWLPRDIDATLQVSYPIEAMSGEQTISTREDSPTCLTTLQLS